MCGIYSVFRLVNGDVCDVFLLFRAFNDDFTLQYYRVRSAI